VTLILDTGPIVAALNELDPDHRRCAELLAAGQDLLIPSPVLVEIDYWLVKLGGAEVWSDFVADINRGAYRVEHPTDADLARAAELEQTYEDLDLRAPRRDRRRHARPPTLLSRAPPTLHAPRAPPRVSGSRRSHICKGPHRLDFPKLGRTDEGGCAWLQSRRVNQHGAASQAARRRYGRAWARPAWS
jgi:uncharacterized protein